MSPGNLPMVINELTKPFINPAIWLQIPNPDVFQWKLGKLGCWDANVCANLK